MNKIICFFAVFCLSLVVIGCNRGPQKPANMPDLTPCVLLLKTDSGPLDDANVELFPVPYDPAGRWTFQGKTDLQGRAVISTMQQFPGVPRGKYSVVVTKRRTDQTQLEDGRVRMKTFIYIDQKYSDRETTPLNIDVQQAAFEQTLDLGKSQEKMIDDSTI